MKKIMAMLPCYNEEQNVEPLVEKWMSLTEPFAQKGYELSVCCVDDKSTDHTAEAITRMTRQYPGRVRLISHAQNQGLGGALRTALTTFASQGGSGDLCVLMDGDNTHDPVYALSMLPMTREEGGACDCVIASRYRAGSETKGVSGPRLLLSGGARAFYTLLLRVPNVRDYTCGFRMYDYEMIAQAIKAYGDRLVERRSFACMMEILYKLYLLGARFGEVPFSLRYDHKQGQSKMRVVKTVWESVKTAVSLRLGKTARPTRKA